MGQLELTALDSDPVRLARVAENLARIGHEARLVAADLLAEDWWDGAPFDRILLDAPCSGTGVIRRHPDIKLLRRADDIHGFAATQLALLERCAPLLRQGGRLLYATCSVLPEENQQVIDRFLARHRELRREREDVALPTTPRAAGTSALTDGFYYACLTKGGESA
jgi:16S rRNA (cytosine967-C5)-methyltransferase